MSIPAALERLLAESEDRDNPAPDRLLEALGRVRTIAVVGLSRDPAKVARRVPAYLAAHGYEVIPVNPNAARIFGRESAKHLNDVPGPVDLVLVFRPSRDARAVVEDAAARPERPVIWLQEGILAPPEAAAARAEGLTVVQDLCLFKVHRAVEDALPLPRAADGS
jgi:predicted CoA-binding protein